MALIAMAVYSTEENKKDDCLVKTLVSLFETVNFKHHRLIISVNAFTDKTQGIIKQFKGLGVVSQQVIYNDTNLGTAEAINLAWKFRNKGEHAIKMDDDVVIHQTGWADLMEEAISRDAGIGIIGLKRKDCCEVPWHENPEWRSELKMLPHTPGHRWIIVEKQKHIMGTCQMYNSALLDKIGYLYQPSLYGYDDVLASHRSHFAGFYNCMLHGIEIDHIDEGATPYQGWKESHSGAVTNEMIQTYRDYASGKKSIYYNPFESNINSL